MLLILYTLILFNFCVFVCLGQAGGGYWQAGSDGLSADSPTPEGFHIELREANRMAIKNTSGQYLQTEKNGGFKLGDNDPSKATLWEF